MKMCGYALIDVIYITSSHSDRSHGTFRSNIRSKQYCFGTPLIGLFLGFHLQVRIRTKRRLSGANFWRLLGNTSCCDSSHCSPA